MTYQEEGEGKDRKIFLKHTVLTRLLNRALNSGKELRKHYYYSKCLFSFFKINIQYKVYDASEKTESSNLLGIYS
jgi:hypothetical protein